MANNNGVVTTGFSNIHVATYASEGGVVSYTGVRKLGRFFSDMFLMILPLIKSMVSVEDDVSTSDDNDFYADDQLAETVGGGTFTSGTGSCEIDGLTPEEEAFVMGLKDGNSVTTDVAVETYQYDQEMDPPYLGLGAVKKVQRDGKSYWKAIVLTKIKFKVPNDDATTQGDSVDWQTQTLDYNILRDDSAKKVWKIVPKTLFTTEAAAVAFIKKVLGDK